MCGLFGFIGRNADGFLIRQLAILASQRGPDSWGFWQSPDPVAHHKGKLDPAHLSNICGCKTLIGHCRLATSGALGVCQPLVCDHLVIAHNGNFYDADRFRRMLKSRPQTDCDSEVLGLAIDAGTAKVGLLRSVVAIMANRLNASPTAFLIASPRRVVAFSEGLPLYQLQRPEGTYFCSLSIDGAMPILGAKEFATT